MRLKPILKHLESTFIYFYGWYLFVLLSYFLNFIVSLLICGLFSEGKVVNGALFGKNCVFSSLATEVAAIEIHFTRLVELDIVDNLCLPSLDKHLKHLFHEFKLNFLIKTGAEFPFRSIEIKLMDILEEILVSRFNASSHPLPPPTKFRWKMLSPGKMQSNEVQRDTGIQLDNENRRTNHFLFAFISNHSKLLYYLMCVCLLLLFLCGFFDYIENKFRYILSLFFRPKYTPHLICVCMCSYLKMSVKLLSTEQSILIVCIFFSITTFCLHSFYIAVL